MAPASTRRLSGQHARPHTVATDTLYTLYLLAVSDGNDSLLPASVGSEFARTVTFVAVYPTKCCPSSIITHTHTVDVTFDYMILSCKIETVKIKSVTFIK